MAVIYTVPEIEKIKYAIQTSMPFEGLKVQLDMANPAGQRKAYGVFNYLVRLSKSDPETWATPEVMEYRKLLKKYWYDHEAGDAYGQIRYARHKKTNAN
ncbi:MAG: hypothetical protein NTU57_02405 [Candidatus Aenigmarchaeota archaeon]|nr:hypothetical protein [Candidatus Aenigmarchaeota archaeon]